MSLTDDRYFWGMPKFEDLCYVKFPDGSINILTNQGANGYNCFNGKRVEILSSLIPYEELQELKSENEVMKLKVESLRELLKECKRYVEIEARKDLPYKYRPYDEEILTRINAAIGESEEQ